MSRSLSVGLGIPASPGTYTAAIEGQTGVYQVLMRRNPSLPPLYGSGVKWEIREGDPKETQWRTPEDIVTSGWADCQELASYRTAELRNSGMDPNAKAWVYPTGENKYHAVVARGNGLVEDPSVMLGMPPFPGEPIMTNQLPAIQGPRGGSPGGGSPVFAPDAMVGMAKSICGLHPYTAMCGIGFFGRETGKGPKLARVKDAAPEFQQPTFHVTGHHHGSIRGWKGVYRTPLKDGTAIVGMTKTHRHPADCVGDGASLISNIANSIAKAPLALAMLSPFSLGTTFALQDPTVQHALGNVGRTVKESVKGKGDDGWPSSIDGKKGRHSVNGPDEISQRDAAIVGWGLSSLTHLITEPLKAAVNLAAKPMGALSNFAFHPSFANLGHFMTSPFQPAMNLATSPMRGLDQAFPVVGRSAQPNTSHIPGSSVNPNSPFAQAFQQRQQQMQQQQMQQAQQPQMPYPDPSQSYPSYDPSQSYGTSNPFATAMTDPSQAAAISSFTNPWGNGGSGGQLGYWNTSGGYMPVQQ